MVAASVDYMNVPLTEISYKCILCKKCYNNFIFMKDHLEQKCNVNDAAAKSNTDLIGVIYRAKRFVENTGQPLSKRSAM